MIKQHFLNILTVIAKVMLFILIIVTAINVKMTLWNFLIVMITLNELCTRPHSITQLKVDMRIIKLISLAISIAVLLKMNGGGIL